MADRALLLSHLPTEGRGFEIGALASPLLPKQGRDLLLVDRLSTEELRAKFTAEGGVPVEQIAEVDVVLGGRALLDALSPLQRDGFDYAIASHVIEHVPDLVGWLADIAKLVRPGGRLLLIVPDKRYSFDYLRELSSLRELVDASVRGSRTPGPGQIFDYNAHAAKVDLAAAWAGRLEAAALSRYSTPAAALELSRTAHQLGTYVDVHCWVVTPARFLDLCADLAELGLLAWDLACFADTRPGDLDFGLVLERMEPGAPPPPIATRFRAAARSAADAPPPPAPVPDPDLGAEVARLRDELAIIRASRSWRLTAPLRRLGHRLRRAAGR